MLGKTVISSARVSPPPSSIVFQEQYHFSLGGVSCHPSTLVRLSNMSLAPGHLSYSAWHRTLDYLRASHHCLPHLPLSTSMTYIGGTIGQGSTVRDPLAKVCPCP